MKILHSWLQDYIEEKLPDAKTLAEGLTKHAFEVEGIEEREGEFILDVDVLPNRASDALSHLGMAREVATLFDLTLKLPPIEFSPSDFSSSDLVNLTISPSVRRGSKRVAREVRISEAPEIIRRRLNLLGQRSINNVVDITNYVMFETGQPVHAFDYEKVAGESSKKIEVRQAREGEVVTLLDGSEYVLDASMLVIADEKRALDIAGVKGGVESGIDENTSQVLLSVCSFTPSNIRRTSQKLGLRTDASKRFENDIAPEMVEFAMARLSFLIAEHAQAAVSRDWVDVYPKQTNPYQVGVTVSEINKILGTDLSVEAVEEILGRLHFSFKRIKPIDCLLELAPQLVGRPYKYGASVSIDAPRYFDCSSFTSYLFAQAGVAIPRITIDQFVYGSPVIDSELKPGDLIFGCNGSGETEEFVRVSDGAVVEQSSVHYESKEYMPGTKVEEGVDHCGLYLGEGKVIHASGKWHRGEVIIEDMDEVSGFKKVVGFRRMTENEERLVIEVPFWRRDMRRSIDIVEEVGRIYGYDNISAQSPNISGLSKSDVKYSNNKLFHYSNLIRDTLIKSGFSEVYTYAFLDQGEIEVMNPLANDKAFLRADLKTGLTRAIEQNAKNKPVLSLDEVRLFEIGKVFTSKREYTELGLAAENPSALTSALQELEDKLSEALNKDVVLNTRKSDRVALINLDDLIDNLPEPELVDFKYEFEDKVNFKPISPYPFVLRDIAVWVPDDLADVDVISVIKEQAGDLLVSYRLFDEYRKDGRVSYAFHLTFQSQERTLSDEEITGLMGEVTEFLNSQEGWEVR